MSISNNFLFFLPNNKKLWTHGASAPTIPFPIVPKQRRRQPWQCPSLAQAASRARAGPPWRRIPVDGAALQCHILILFMTPSMVMSHLPLEPQPGVLYRNLRIIVISSSLMAATCLSVYLLRPSSMSTIPSSTSSEVEDQHVVPAALPLVPRTGTAPPGWRPSGRRRGCTRP